MYTLQVPGVPINRPLVRGGSKAQPNEKISQQVMPYFKEKASTSRLIPKVCQLVKILQNHKLLNTQRKVKRQQEHFEINAAITKMHSRYCFSGTHFPASFPGVIIYHDIVHDIINITNSNTE